MEIKEGYNGKPLRLTFRARPETRTTELWLTQEGLEALPSEFQKYKETLSYVTLDELLDLKDEIAAAIKEITR